MGGWGYLLERNDSRQSALAARRAATKEQTSAAKWRIEEELLAPCLHFGGRCSGRRSRGHRFQCTLAVGVAPESCLSHPPALRLGSALGGGWAGIFSRAREWPPACAGGGKRSKVSAGHAAKLRFQTALDPVRVTPGGQCVFVMGTIADALVPWPPVCHSREHPRPALSVPAHPGRRCVARGICLSHPPALQLASVLGAGGWEYLPNCNKGRQRALAATLAATIDQLWRPTSSQRASKCRSLKRWRMALRRQYTCIGAPSPLRS